MKIILKGTAEELREFIGKEPHGSGVPEWMIRAWLTEREAWLRNMKANPESEGLHGI